MSTAIVTNTSTGEVITTNEEQQEILDEAYEELGEDATTEEVVALLTEWLVEDDLHGFTQSDVSNTLFGLTGSMEVLLENPDIVLDEDTAASVVYWGTTSASLSGQADAIMAEASVEEQSIFDELSEILENIENGDGDGTDYGDTITTDDTAAMLELAKHANSVSEALMYLYMAIVVPAANEGQEAIVDSIEGLEEILNQAREDIEGLSITDEDYEVKLQLARDDSSRALAGIQALSSISQNFVDAKSEFLKMQATIQDKEFDVNDYILRLFSA